ncbi:MAG TPA: hypothetical protein VJZ49_00450 [Syntrophales bacterium]|nr:hypothetical protein [Syntrophales bacterium]
MACDVLNLAHSYHRGRPNLFIFGSVDSFLKAGKSLFDKLDGLPYATFINVGMESPDQETLDSLGKPIRAEEVKDAFRRQILKEFREIKIVSRLPVFLYLAQRL